jgi:hypothetical protein
MPDIVRLVRFEAFAMRAREIYINPKDIPKLRRQLWFDLNTHPERPYVGYVSGCSEIFADPTVPKGTLRSSERATPGPTPAQQEVIRRGVNHDALAHYKSIALRQCLAQGYVVRTRQGGWYRTTEKGRLAVNEYLDLFARLLEDS